MSIKFDPNNVVIKLCMKGIQLEDSRNNEDAVTMFQIAWREATDDYERFIAAYHLARQQKSIPDKLIWLETSLQCARNINDVNVKSAYSTLYFNIAKCYEELCDSANANGAGLAATLAKGEGRERVYIIEPIGEFENDPNVTDKKFPGNLTRSYRSQDPLRIIGEETEWAKLTTMEQSEWRQKLAKNKGEIIN